MNILEVTNTYLPHVGGVARSVHSFAEDYRLLGHKVLIVAPEFDNIDTTKEDGVFRVPAIRNFNGSDFSVSYPVLGLLDEALEAFVPDIVHSHHPFLLGNTACRIAESMDIPLVFTHHTLYEKYTHYVPLNAHKLKQYVTTLATEYANLCDAVFAPSESIAHLIKERGVTAPIRIQPTGIDCQCFGSGNRQVARKQYGIPQNAQVIGHLGRLAPEKNLSYLAEAVALMLKENNDAVFLVVGEGPSQSNIQSVFEKTGLTQRLFFAGKQTGPALANAYAAMDIFVFSSFSETQGMVLVEAMAAGLPVVALDANGVRDCLSNTEAGVLLPRSASPEQFSQTVLKIISSSEECLMRSDKAREVASNYGRRPCAVQALRHYVDLISKNDKTSKPSKTLKFINHLSGHIEAEWKLAAANLEAFNKTW